MPDDDKPVMRADILGQELDADYFRVESEKAWALMDRKHENFLTEFRRCHDDIVRCLEAFAKWQREFEKAFIFVDMRCNREQRRKDHERRIRALESPPPL
ncbi:MAG TPA: hypothetical protein DD417_01020 [Elusimicrobia bacterium]|nr:hypothetical protein [Elusimicrobiota bacterium]